MKEKLIIESRIEEIERVYQWLHALLKENIPQQLSRTILLIVQEITTNSVFHGNKCSVEKQVIVTFEETSSNIVINIKDQGEGIKKLPTKEEAQELSYLEEDGRGLKLAVLMSDQIDFNGSNIRVVFNKAS